MDSDKITTIFKGNLLYNVRTMMSRFMKRVDNFCYSLFFVRRTQSFINQAKKITLTANVTQPNLTQHDPTIDPEIGFIQVYKEEVLVKPIFFVQSDPN